MNQMFMFPDAECDNFWVIMCKVDISTIFYSPSQCGNTDCRVCLLSDLVYPF